MNSNRLYPARSHSAHGLAACYGGLAEMATWACLAGPAHGQPRRTPGARPGRFWNIERINGFQKLKNNEQ
jgi:hypothetical protein